MIQIQAVQRLLVAEPMGTVQTIHCYRDGDLRWTKDVWVPAKDQEKFYATYVSKAKGAFFYDVSGDIKSLPKRPRNVPMWNNF